MAKRGLHFLAMELNGYTLSKRWFEFVYENNSIVKPSHTALFFWCVDLWNRLGMPKEFFLTSTEARMAMSVSRSDVFTGCLSDLHKWGFIEIVKPSKNQYQANIIRICYKQNVESTDKALLKAIVKHGIKQTPLDVESTVDINKHINLETNETIKRESLEFEKWFDELRNANMQHEQIARLYRLQMADVKFLVEQFILHKKIEGGFTNYKDLVSHCSNWIKHNHKEQLANKVEAQPVFQQERKLTLQEKLERDLKLRNEGKQH